MSDEKKENMSVDDMLRLKYTDFLKEIKRFLCKNAGLTSDAKKIIRQADIRMCIWSVHSNRTTNAVKPVIISQNDDKKGSVSLEIEKAEFIDHSKNAHNAFVQNVENAICQKFGPENVLLGWNSEKTNTIFFTGVQNYNCTHSFRIVWFAFQKESFRAQEKSVLDVLLHILSLIDNLGCICQTEIRHFESMCRPADEYFIKMYQFLIRERYPYLPDFQKLTEISFQHYEKQENDSVIYFFPEGDYHNSWLRECGIVDIHSKHSVCIEEDNVAGVRKLLETCKNGDRKLIAVGRNKDMHITSIVDETEDEHSKMKVENQLYVSFKGIGQWRLFCKNEVILMYKEGRYYTDEDQEKEDLSKKLKEIPGIEDCQIQHFVKLIQHLQEQPHGALLIISSEAEKEANRLCKKYGRGFWLDGLELFGKSAEASKNREIFKGLSGIDGAVLVNLDGICYGFSVILDGKASEDGDVGRGSRYNSAVTYIKEHSGCVVIISEDKEKPINVEYGNNSK